MTADYARYLSAVQTFRDKYMAIPGDMLNATRFWGDDNAACPDAAITNGSPGVCNGNGDGYTALSGAANAPTEGVQFWKHLALAGLIEGSYTGLIGSGSGYHLIPGTNVPASRVRNGGWLVNAWDGSGTDTEALTGMNYGNHFGFGGSRTNSTTTGQILTPQETWNIDTKLDDGKPGYGIVVPRFWNNACLTGMASSSAFANASYNLTDNSPLCSVYFLRQF